MAFPVPGNESNRLASLIGLGLLNSPNSPEFDAIAELAADILECPIALISLVGENDQWFKANRGLEADGTSRDVAFCGHTIMGDEPMIVNDARIDERFMNNPLVLGNPSIAFYAGIPISIDGIHNLGTLCAIDTVPRQLSDLQLTRLRGLARVTEGLIREFKSKRQAEEARRREEAKSIELSKMTSLLDQITKLSGVGGWELSLDTDALTWTSETRKIHEVLDSYEPSLEAAIGFYAPEARLDIKRAVENAKATGSNWDLELPMLTAKGSQIWVRTVGRPTYQDGALVSLIGAFQNITPRKHSEVRLRESEESAHAKADDLTTILKNMDQGVSVFDKDLNLLVWNQRYIDIFEKPKGEVREGVSLRSLLKFEKLRGDFPEDIETHLQDMVAQLNQQETVSYNFRTKNGKVISSTHAPMPNGGWVGTHSDVTVQVLAAERDEYAAHHDQLTSLPNRLAFNKRMEVLQEKIRDGNTSIILMILDLDGFKLINDTYGHHIGDDLLKAVAERIRNCVRKSDLVARLGGDEFAVVIDCNIPESRALAGKIAAKINREIQRPFKVDDNVLAIGVSVGLYMTQAPFEIDAIMVCADSALYKAKESGRGGYQFYDAITTTHASVHRRKSVAIQSAVEDQRLKLVFQPIFDLKNLKICGAEALIRWDDTDFSDLSAAELVQIAEENGSIEQIGNWVLEQSLQAASTWDDDIKVSVNVSPKQLGRGDLLYRIWNILEFSCFPASRLELEITENQILQENSTSIKELQEIKSLGVKIALDDFGSGYASLSYLQRFAFDKIKIDQSIVQGNENKGHSELIVKSIVNLAQDLGIETTAEGIQSRKLLKEMTEVGCSYGQGFFMAQPMTGEKFMASSQFRPKVA